MALTAPQKGARFWIGLGPNVGTGGSDLKECPCFIELNMPQRTREALDDTCHNDPGQVRQFTPESTYDPGQMEITWRGEVDDDWADHLNVIWDSLQEVWILFGVPKADGTRVYFIGKAVATGLNLTGALGTQGKQTGNLSMQLSGPLNGPMTAAAAGVA